MSTLLKDSFNRTIDYCRISVTDRCNLRCVYCMPKNGVEAIPHSEVLRYEEILRLIGILEKTGISKFRITGGEPLVRKGIFEFLKIICEKNIYITTNLNCNETAIDELNSLKLSGINISLDSLKQNVYENICGGGSIETVRRNIKLLKNKNIKINTVVIKGLNDKEIADFIEFGLENNCTVRFIEKMNMNGDNLNFIANEKIIGSLIKENIIENSPEVSGDCSVAEYYMLKNNNGKVGFISPNTKKFCSSCNKLRITSDGYMRLCLFDTKKYDLKKLLRNNSNDSEIIEFIREIVKKKWAGYEDSAGDKMYYHGG